MQAGALHDVLAFRSPHPPTPLQAGATQVLCMLPNAQADVGCHEMRLVELGPARRARALHHLSRHPTIHPAQNTQNTQRVQLLGPFHNYACIATYTPCVTQCVRRGPRNRGLSNIHQVADRTTRPSMRASGAGVALTCRPMRLFSTVLLPTLGWPSSAITALDPFPRSGCAQEERG